MTEISMIGKFSPYKFQNKDNSTYVRIHHFGEIGYGSYKGHRGFTYSPNGQDLPPVEQFIQDADEKPVYWDKEIQEHYFEILKRSTVGLTLSEQKKILQNIMKGNIAYFNKQGWDNGKANYVLGLNLSGQNPYMTPVFTTGSTHKLLSQWVTSKGLGLSTIQAFDMKTEKNRFLNSDPWGDEWYLWATCVMSKDLLDSHGKLYEEIYPWPRTEKIGGAYVYMPIMNFGKNYRIIQTEFLEKIKDEDIHPSFPLNKNFRGLSNRNRNLERVAR